MQYFMDQRLAGVDDDHPLPPEYRRSLMAEYRRRQRAAQAGAAPNPAKPTGRRGGRKQRPASGDAEKGR